MEFTISRTIILDELSKANKIIDVRNLNPLLGGILLEITSDNLTIVSSSGLISYKVVLNNENSDLEIIKPGKILIKSKYILEMLRKLDDDFITFIVVENNELILRTKDTEFNISILDAEDYPILGFRETGEAIKLNPKELRKTIYQVLISINEWNKKIILTGMNFKFLQNEMIISATDMHRISQKIVQLETTMDHETELTIPYKTMIELPKIIENSKNITIFINEGYVTFKIDNSLLQSNIIDGQFPNVQGAFPKESLIKLKIEAKKILKTLSRASLPSEDGIIPIVTLKINKNEIIVKTAIADVGHYEEKFFDYEIEQENSNNELFISFNSKYITEAIKTFENDIIEIKFIDPTKPVVINKVDNHSLKQVVLPTYIGE